MDKAHNWIGKEVTRFQAWCLKLGHGLSLVCLVFAMVWGSGKEVAKDKMLGGLHLVFSYHPICMVLGFIVCMGGGIGAFRTARLGRVGNKRMHVIWHTTAFIFVSIGLRTVWISHNIVKAPNLYTIHGILGLLLCILFYAQYVIGAITFLFTHKKKFFFSKLHKERILEMHVPVGIIIYLLSTAVIVSGIAEKLAWMKCTYYPRADARETPIQLDKIDSNPVQHFMLIPLGCRVAFGVGLSALLSASCIVLGVLSLRVGRDSDHLFQNTNKYNPLPTSVPEIIHHHSLAAKMGGAGVDTSILPTDDFSSSNLPSTQLP